MAAEPAYAASTCSQTPWRRQIASTAGTGSTAVDEVVPMEATTQAGAAGMTRVGFGDTILPVLQKPFEDHQLEELIETALELSTRRQSQPVTIP